MDLNDQNGLEFEFLVPMGWGSLDLTIVVEVGAGLEDLESERVFAMSNLTGDIEFELAWDSIKAIEALWSDLCDAGDRAIELARDEAEAHAA